MIPHRRILAGLGASYVAIMGGVLAWAGADYYRHIWRPAHR